MTINLRNLVDLTVPEYLIITVFGTLSAFLVISGTMASATLLVPLILSLSFTVLALNALNQVYDQEIDSVSKPERPIPSKRVTAREAKLVSLFFYLMAFAVAFTVNMAFACIIAMYIIISVLYSIPPARLRRLPFATIIFGPLFHSIIPFVSAWTITADSFPYIFFIFFWGIGLIMSSVKDLEDVKGDKKAGIKNFCTVFGSKNTIRFISIAFLLLVLALLFLSFFSIINQKYVIASLLSLLLLAILVYRYNKTNTEGNIITQSRLVTFGMIISILIQLSYGLISIIF